MANCLVLSEQEKKEYLDLGVSLFEVNRDYLENGEVLRSPIVIKYKLDVRNDDITDKYFEESNREIESELELKNSFDNKTSENWIFQLSKSLNVDFQIIDKEAAIEIHRAMGQVYNNQPGFLAKGIVYFLKGKVTPESVVHEFSHPLISSLESSVINKLYETASQRIKDEINQKYKDDKEVDAETLKKEVLVLELTHLVAIVKETPKLQSRLDRILYQIKQMLRRLLGRSVNVKNLTGETTLKELAKMLAKGTTLSLQKELLFNSDIIEYYHNKAESHQALEKKLEDDEGRKEVQKIINRVFNFAQETKREFNKNPELFPFRELVVNEQKHGVIDMIFKGMQPLSTENMHYLEDTMDKMTDEDFKENLDKVKLRISEIVNSLYKLKEFQILIIDELEKTKDFNSEKGMKQLLHYASFRVEFDGLIKAFENISEYTTVEGVSEDNSLLELYNELSRNTSIINKSVQTKLMPVLKDQFYEALKSSAIKAKEVFDNRIAKLEADKESTTHTLGKNAVQRSIDMEFKAFMFMTEEQYERYNELKKDAKLQKDNEKEYNQLHKQWLFGLEFTEEKAGELLEGKGPDADYWNGMLESLSMNADPALASVHQFIEDRKARLDIESFAFYNRFIDTVNEYVSKYSLVYQNRGAVGRLMGFLDKRGVVNSKTGEVDLVHDKSFLYEWRDWEYDETVHTNNIDQAVDKKDVGAERKARREYQLWKNKYMNQDFAVEVYEAWDLLLKDDIGIDATERMQLLKDQIEILNLDNKEENYNIIENIRIQIKNLSSVTDLMGNKKTGRDLEIAERLQEYNETAGKFHVEQEIEGAFEIDLETHKTYIQSQLNYKPGSKEYKEEIKKWIRHNTRTVLKNSLYDRKKALIDRKAELMSRVNEENKALYDDVEQQQLINEKSNEIKDEGNQPNGNKSTAEVRKKVLEAHKKIEDIRQNYIGKSGLSKIDFRTLRELNTRLNESTLTASEKKELEKLLAKQTANKQRLGLNSEAISEINDIDTKLQELSGSIPTDYYKQRIIELLNTKELKKLFNEFLKASNYDLRAIEDLFTEEFLEFINSKQGKDAMELSKKLKDFIEQNHYRSFDGVDLYAEPKLKPTKLWIVNVGNPQDYKTKRLRWNARDKKGDVKFDEAGNTISENKGILQEDGLPRIPSTKYYAPIYKDEYVTKEIVGKTVDNRGKWLPKEPSKDITNRYRNDAYYDLKKNDPNNFELMEKMKEDYLIGQVNAEEKNRLFYDFPRIENTRLENVITGNVSIWARKLKDFAVGREDDVLELKWEAMNIKRDRESLSGQSILKTSAEMPVIGATRGKGRRMDEKDVSDDIFKTIPQYIGSINVNQAAQESNTYARFMQQSSIDSLVERNGKDINTSEKRDHIFEHLIAREIDGIMATGRINESRHAQKILGAILSRASKMTFNWNLISGVVNWNQMKLTAMTHAVAMEDMDVLDGAAGQVFSTETSLKVSRDIRRRKKKSLNEQMLLIFDPISGRNLDTLGDSLSRTYLGDWLDLKPATNMRKWLEMEGTLHIFGGVMHNRKIEVTDKDGNKKMIPYLYAFELNEDGNIQTIEGLDPHYALTYDKDGKIQSGDGLIKTRNNIHNIVVKYNGAFAKKDNPLMSRYFIAKAVLYLKKYVISYASKQYHFSTRHGKRGKAHFHDVYKKSEIPSVRKRMNYTTGEATLGNLPEAIRGLSNILRSIQSQKWLVSNTELSGIIYSAFQAIMISVIIPFFVRLVTPFLPFWDDPDDADKQSAIFLRIDFLNGRLKEEKDLSISEKKEIIKEIAELSSKVELPDMEKINYNKMDSRSGPIDWLPGTAGRDGTSWNLKGYMLNSLAAIMVKTQDEYQSVSWIGGARGFQELTLHTQSRGIGLEIVGKQLSNLFYMASGKKRSIYQRDSGPMWYQQEGYKMETPVGDIHGRYIETLMKFMAMPQKNIDPTRKYLKPFKDREAMN